ncbi:hypothetical protein KUCAC02_000730, partial [Chaenocephalus aceratus]
TTMEEEHEKRRISGSELPDRSSAVINSAVGFGAGMIGCGQNALILRSLGAKMASLVSFAPTQLTSDVWLPALHTALSSVLTATFDKSSTRRRGSGWQGAASPVVADTSLAPPGPTLAEASANAARTISTPHEVRAFCHCEAWDFTSESGLVKSSPCKGMEAQHKAFCLPVRGEEEGGERTGNELKYEVDSQKQSSRCSAAAQGSRKRGGSVSVFQLQMHAEIGEMDTCATCVSNSSFHYSLTCEGPGQQGKAGAEMTLGGEGVSSPVQPGASVIVRVTTTRA